MQKASEFSAGIIHGRLTLVFPGPCGKKVVVNETQCPASSPAPHPRPHSTPPHFSFPRVKREGGHACADRQDWGYIAAGKLACTEKSGPLSHRRETRVMPFFALPLAFVAVESSVVRRMLQIPNVCYRGRQKHRCVYSRQVATRRGWKSSDNENGTSRSKYTIAPRCTKHGDI